MLRAVVVEQLHVVVAAVVEQLRVAALVSEQLHVVAAFLVRPRALAVLSAQLRVRAELLERSPFATLSSSVCSRSGSCSHALAVSLRRLWSYVRLSRRRLYVRRYVLA